MPTSLPAHVKDTDLRQLLNNALTSHFMSYQSGSNTEDREAVDRSGRMVEKDGDTNID